MKGVRVLCIGEMRMNSVRSIYNYQSKFVYFISTFLFLGIVFRSRVDYQDSWILDGLVILILIYTGIFLFTFTKRSVFGIFICIFVCKLMSLFGSKSIQHRLQKSPICQLINIQLTTSPL